MLSHRSIPPTSQPIPKKRQGFFARLTNPSSSPGSNRTPGPSAVEHAISWLCGSDSNLQNWAQILELSDRLSVSETDSKEAVRALKKEMKHATPDVQVRAIRLTVILVLNSSDRFRLQIASKKFLESIEDIYTKAGKNHHLNHNRQSAASALSVKEMILKAFSVLGYEFQHDADLYVFTNFYNRIKPADAPINGTALAESDGVFTPASVVRPTPVRDTHPPPRPVLAPHPAQLNPAPYPAPPQMQALMPEMRDVKAEAEIARSNARLLVEALAFTVPAEMDSNEIIKEFHAKCLQSQNQLMDDIPWATAQAEQARAYLAASQRRSQPQPHMPARLSRTNPYAPLVNEAPGELGGASEGQATTTREEQLLEMLLSANTELIDAFRQFDELERLARSEAEVRAVEELSKHETRGGREHALLEPSGPGQAQSSASGSRSPSPKVDPGLDLPGSSKVAVRASSPDEPPAKTGCMVQSSHEPQDQQDCNRPEGYKVPPDVPQPTAGYVLPDESHMTIDSDEVKKHECAGELDNEKFYGRAAVFAAEEKEDEEIVTPIEPSEKALGKIRRISVRHNSLGDSQDGDDQEEVERRQKELEEKLRAKYKLIGKHY